VTRLLVRLVDLYRATLSRVLPRLCRFEPSCSAYAREALVRHGAAKGTLLAVYRVLRCNPLCRGGTDPVPPPGRWRTLPDAPPDRSAGGPVSP
jgi:putative membrane protein insertion efficiency factor